MNGTRTQHHKTNRVNVYAMTPLMLIFSLLMILSCNKNDDFGEVNSGSSQYIDGNGVFIINEGNYGQGNGSLSFLNLDSMKIGNDIFSQANSRPVGDVPFSMQIVGKDAWIVVNNSARIEVVNLENMKSMATIPVEGSPRFAIKVQPNKLYISNFSLNRIFIADIQNQRITGEIPLTGSTEQMVLATGKVFAAFWSNYHFPTLNNNRIFVIDPKNDQFIDSVIVGKEPNSMVVDKNGKLWVLCSGGFLNDELPSLWRIKPDEPEVEFTLQFPEINSSPTSLCINGTGDTLLFLNQGIFKMAISDSQLPPFSMIPENEHLFYSLAVHPVTSTIFATDAIDYQQRGMVLRYTTNGTFTDSFRAGIIPGFMMFSKNED